MIRNRIRECYHQHHHQFYIICQVEAEKSTILNWRSRKIFAAIVANVADDE